VAATGKQSCTAPPTSKCTAPGSLDTRLSLSGGAEHRLVPGGSCVVGAGVAVLFNQPFGVVSGDESADGIAHIIDGLVDAPGTTCSLKVRKKRSMTPFVCGSPTNA